jgi:hypothetical protein
MGWSSRCGRSRSKRQGPASEARSAPRQRPPPRAASPPPRVAIGSSIAAGALGQWIGQEAERRLGRAKAVEIHYRDENTNEEFVLVQAESAKAPIRPGDRIRVVIGPESVRATRIDPATTR